MSDPIMLGTEKEYADCVLRLIDESSNFIDDIRSRKIKFLTASSRCRIDELIESADSCEMQKVRSIAPSLQALNGELSNLLKKFQIIKSAHRTDETLKSFLGDYTQNPSNSCSKLISFIDSSIIQMDSVIAKYSDVDRAKKPAHIWIMTVLSNRSGDSVSKKARKARLVLESIRNLIDELQGMCHSSKLELLNIRNTASKNLSKAGRLTYKSPFDNNQEKGAA
ncbi:TPA: hypothetical protein H1008_02245 [archaeon]|nr:hypothetical protein [Candidatus Undinarchaeales archaeon SRR5007147.bin71]